MPPKGNRGIREPRTSPPSKSDRRFSRPARIRVRVLRTTPDRRNTGRTFPPSSGILGGAKRGRRDKGESGGFSRGIPRCPRRIRPSNSGSRKISKRGGRFVRGNPFSFLRTEISNIRERIIFPIRPRERRFRKIFQGGLPPFFKPPNMLGRGRTHQAGRARPKLRSIRRCVLGKIPSTLPFSRADRSLSNPMPIRGIPPGAKGRRDGRFASHGWRIRFSGSPIPTI